MFLFGVMAALAPGVTLGADSAESSACSFCSPVAEVIDGADRAAAIQRLRKDFRVYVGAGEIGECDAVVEQGFAHFSAVAGVCKVRFGNRETTWLVCSDNGVGNFAASIGVRGIKPPSAQPRDFISNCVGG